MVAGHLALSFSCPKRGRAFAQAIMPQCLISASLRPLWRHCADKLTMTSLALQFLYFDCVRGPAKSLAARWERDRSRGESVDRSGRADERRWALEHRVPLSSAAMAIVEKMAAIRTVAFVFAGQRRGARLSDGALRLVVPDGVTAHGFRSALPRLVRKRDKLPARDRRAGAGARDGGAVELAYRRGDALEKRRALMKAWGRFCVTGGKIVQLRTAG